MVLDQPMVAFYKHMGTHKIAGFSFVYSGESLI
jgi:hypothetical protein